MEMRADCTSPKKPASRCFRPLALAPVFERESFPHEALRSHPESKRRRPVSNEKTPLSSWQYVDHRQQRVEDMEHDLERVRSRLVDIENSLGFLKQECYHEEREGHRLQRELEEEVRLMDSQLERFRRDDTTLAKHWEAQRFRADQAWDSSHSFAPSSGR
ncbi:RPP25L [Symbiodinium natans]|uniref:RPP25L protein n=1 Tax=Symbiodinium natans TaxID=878477 RepID=A0A812LXT0_9DINO|nr:RPP25L [Symbiodinium natans]